MEVYNHITEFARVEKEIAKLNMVQNMYVNGEIPQMV